MPRIDKTVVSLAPYIAVRRDSMASGIQEKADCAVVAVTAATGRSYAEVHAAMKANGRRDKKGTPMFVTENTLAQFGFKMERVNRSYFIGRYPKAHQILQSVTTHHPDRFPAVWKDGCTYMLRTRRHILTVKDGVNCDWTRGSAKRAEEIYRITPVNGF